MTVDRSKSVSPLDFAYDSGELGFVFDDGKFEIAEAVMPNFSAYNEETEEWRLRRLVRVWESADAIVSLLSDKYQSRWNGAIRSLRDNKGMLRVIWRDEQSRILFEGAIAGAWQRLAEFWCSHGLSSN